MKYLNFSARKIYLFAKSFSYYTEFRRDGKRLFAYYHWVNNYVKDIIAIHIKEINLFNKCCGYETTITN